MRKFWRSFFVVFLLLPFYFIIFVSSVSAKIISSEEAVTITADEIIEDDLFIGGETVTVEGTINGDLYAAAGMVTVSGRVNGDVLAAGGMVDISGVIKDDLRVAGGNITIHKASIGDNMTVFGGNISVDEQTKVGGSVVFGAGLVDSSAEVGRGVLGGSGTMTLDGKVGKSVVVGVGALSLGPKAQITGDLTYTSDEEAEISEKASISGSVSRLLPAKAEVSRGLPAVMKQIGLGFKLWSYFAALIIGVLILIFFRKPSEKIAFNILEKPWQSLLFGFLFLVLSGPALILLMLSGIGFPLALILGGIFLLELYLTKIFVGILFGRSVAEFLGRKELNIYLSLALGLVIYYLLTALPIIGFFIFLATLIFGLGAIFSYKREILVSQRS